MLALRYTALVVMTGWLTVSSAVMIHLELAAGADLDAASVLSGLLGLAGVIVLASAEGPIRRRRQG